MDSDRPWQALNSCESGDTLLVPARACLGIVQFFVASAIRRIPLVPKLHRRHRQCFMCLVG